MTAVIYTHLVQVFQPFNPVNEKHAVQVINLVVNHHRVKAPKDALKGLAPFIEAGYMQEMRAYCFGVEARKAETAIEIFLHVPSFSDLRVAQCSGWARLPRSAALTTQLDYDDLIVNVDLVSS
jgi:hypothetical protein